MSIDRKQTPPSPTPALTPKKPKSATWHMHAENWVRWLGTADRDRNSAGNAAVAAMDHIGRAPAEGVTVKSGVPNYIRVVLGLKDTSSGLGGLFSGEKDKLVKAILHKDNADQRGLAIDALNNLALHRDADVGKQAKDLLSMLKNELERNKGSNK